MKQRGRVMRGRENKQVRTTERGMPAHATHTRNARGQKYGKRQEARGGKRKTIAKTTEHVMEVLIVTCKWRMEREEVTGK